MFEKRETLTGVRGVSFVRQEGKPNRFRARIEVHGRAVSLGVYDTAEEASEVYEREKKIRDGVIVEAPEWAEQMMNDKEFLNDVVKVISEGVFSIPNDISAKTRVSLLNWCKQMNKDAEETDGS